ncbi:hypothetical protein DWB61_17690 [Ancylomarina euxinus]|uniref:Uncharacterized protein n=1 Tax=Ancylomarina euxinus TaxID=2283627 RepID=A0A425XW73_9BACT|nr:hypothetical protein [Ancylomarina euxinus]MCZ4696489.1 hypothetical protein [Ancylomarina euxinus]RRG18932.1 hypothetical protein DWB61_17690 [Ancylomarina euxinus]
MKKEIIKWLNNIEKQDGTPPDSVIAFNLGLMESEQGFVKYFVGAFEYSEEDDDWACIEPPSKPYRYLRLPEEVQNEPWETILNLSNKAFYQLESDGTLNKTLIKNAKAITTGFDDGELLKIR